MARAPRFAVVGRLGLPVAAVAVAAALWSTTTWALASPGADSPSSVLPLPATGGLVRGCSPAPLRAAAVTKLHCTVVTNGSALTLLARTSVAGHTFEKAYAHR